MKLNITILIVVILALSSSLVLARRSCDKRVKGYTYENNGYSVNSMNNRQAKARSFVQTSFISMDYVGKRMLYFFSYTEGNVTVSAKSYYIQADNIEYRVRNGICYKYLMNYELDSNFYSGLTKTGDVQLGEYDLKVYTTEYDAFTYNVYIDTKKCAFVNSVSSNKFNVTNTVGGSAVLIYNWEDEFAESQATVPSICFTSPTPSPTPSPTSGPSSLKSASVDSPDFLGEILPIELVRHFAN
eukprot:gene8589-10568_t